MFKLSLTSIRWLPRWSLAAHYNRKLFSIPVDLILHFSQTVIKTTVNAEWLSIVISTNCFLILVQFDLFALPCAQRAKKSLIVLRETRSTAWSLHLRTMNVAAEHAIPNCCSKMHWASPTRKCFLSWKVTSDFPSRYSVCDVHFWHPESNWYFAVDQKSPGFCHWLCHMCQSYPTVINDFLKID